MASTKTPGHSQSSLSRRDFLRLASLTAGVAADVFAACCAFFPILAQEGQTIDLRPYIEADLDQEALQE